MPRLAVLLAASLGFLIAGVAVVAKLDDKSEPEAVPTATEVVGPNAVRHLDAYLSLSQAKRFRRYPIYYLGPEFRGMPLNPDFRLVVAAAPIQNEPLREDWMGIVYGDCQPRPCYPPLQLKISNGCERNERSLDIPPDDRVMVRGVKAAYYDERSRLEIYTGVVTIVIGTEYDTKHLIPAATRGLRSLDGRIRPGEPLPRRVPLVLDKKSSTCVAMLPRF